MPQKFVVVSHEFSESAENRRPRHLAPAGAARFTAASTNFKGQFKGLDLHLTKNGSNKRDRGHFKLSNSIHGQV